MTDPLSSAERSERMGRIKGRDSKPEMAVRRLVHAMGYRYRLHRGDLPGKPDLTLPRHRAVIFVHGCFWHQHLDPACRLARMPKSRLSFWGPKLERNRERDERVASVLTQEGWRVLTVWECELRDRESLATKIKSFLGEEA